MGLFGKESAGVKELIYSIAHSPYPSGGGSIGISAGGELTTGDNFSNVAGHTNYVMDNTTGRKVKIPRGYAPPNHLIKI